MIRFLADENFNNDVLRGFQRRLPSIDIVRVVRLPLVGYTFRISNGGQKEKPRFRRAFQELRGGDTPRGLWLFCCHSRRSLRAERRVRAAGQGCRAQE